MVAQVPSYVPIEGLVAWYSFDGNGEDASENGNDLVQIGAPLWSEVDGRPFVDLPGDGEHFYHPLDSFPVVDEFSIAMWVRIDVPSGSGAVGSVRPIASKHYSGSAGSFILNNDNGAIGGISHGWALGEWHHLVLTLSSTSRTYYFDGVLAGGNDNDFWSNTTYPFMIGGWLNQPWWSNNWSNSALSFDGGIGAVGVWNRVLTAEEVSTVFNEYIPGCTDVTACNYDSSAGVDNGTCEYGCNYCGNGTEWNAALNECVAVGSVCGTGFTWNAEQQSCVPIEEICGPGTEWNSFSQTCVPDVTCISDLNLDGVVGSSDLLIMLAAFGLPCESDAAEWTCGDVVPYYSYDYQTVLIGEQCWFAENLRSQRYSNGDSIINPEGNFDWQLVNEGLQGVYDNQLENLNLYGRLYNWYAANDIRGVCPVGWRVPSDDDFKALEVELGMSQAQADSLYWRGTDQGTQLKSSAQDEPSWNGSNSSGFSALPGGMKFNEYSYAGVIGSFWASPAVNGSYMCRELHGNGQVYRDPDNNPWQGFSLRCLMDSE